MPKREVELRSRGSSECITRPMTEEERLKYGATTPPKITNAEGVQERRPIQLPPRKYEHVTKELVLAEFAKGKTVLQIEREQGMKPNTLYGRLREWGINSPRSPKLNEKEPAKRLPTPPQVTNSAMKWEPWVTYKCETALTIPINEPPCKHCARFKPRMVTNSFGDFDGVRLCAADEMRPDFSCYREKEASR